MGPKSDRCCLNKVFGPTIFHLTENESEVKILLCCQIPPGCQCNIVLITGPSCIEELFEANPGL